MADKNPLLRTGATVLGWTLALGIALAGSTSAWADVTNTDTSTTYSTIQAAVDAAGVGHTLVVDPGTYEEQVVIDKNLTILGSGVGSTTIASPTTLTTFFNTGDNDNYPIVFIDGADDVTIQDLTIDGLGRGNSNYRFQGVGFYNGGGTLLGLDVTGVRDTPFSGAQHGVAVYAFTDDGGPNSLEIGNVDIDDFQKNAMTLIGSGLTVDVHGCATTGAGPTTVTAQNGIQISGGATGTVTGCVVADVAYTGPDYTATGCLFYGAGTVDCDDVIVDGCQTSVYYIDGSGVFQNSAITNPIGDGLYAYQSAAAVAGSDGVSPPQAHPVDAFSTGGSGQDRAAIDVSVLNCVATGSAVTDSWGVTAYGYGPVVFTVENCDIGNWDWGVVTWDFGGAMIDATIFDNDLGGNTTYSVATNLTDVQDASGNWHGAADAATVASLVDGPIDYSPWLDDGTDQDGGTPGFQGDFSVLNVDDNSPTASPPGGIAEALALVSGSTINVAPGTYSGNLVLSSSVNLLGAQSGVDARGRVVGPPDDSIESVLTAASGIILELDTGCAGSIIDGFTFSGSDRAIDTTGPTDEVEIRNNYFTGHANVALFMNNNGVDMTVHQNEFDGSSLASTVVHFDQDDFDGLHFTSNNVLDGPGTGFFVDGDHNVGASISRAPSFDGNVFDGNETGANLGRFAFEDGTISDNTFSNSGFDGLQGGIQSSSIAGNTFDSNGRYGLALTGFGGDGDPTRGAQDNTITGNYFLGNGTAGLLFSSGQYPGTISTNVANDNDLVGNAVGASYSGSETIDISCNWWGDAGGPDAPGNPNPPGDEVVGSSLVYWSWLDGSIAGSPSCTGSGDDLIAADPTGLCISTATPCVTVPVEFDRLDMTDARGASVTFQLSPELELCDPNDPNTPAAQITQGTWLDGFGTTYQVIDNGGGSYTVDQAILGATCGVDDGGLLFEIQVQKTSAVTTDAVGTISVTEVKVRDCNNVPLAGLPGADAMIPINLEAPDAPTSLATAQVKTGNDTDGNTEIDVSFTLPVAADFDYVDIYRKGYGDYPEYDDGTGAVPAMPASPGDALSNGWTLAVAGATSSPVTDDPDDRDYWYYVAFAYDECGNVSATSNMTDGVLSYHLGDVTDGITNGVGDNAVATNDVSHLGANYGLTLAHADSVNYLDVGPTSDSSVDGLPQTDNLTNFEDLILFAINYGVVSLTGDREVVVQNERTESPVLRLEVAERATRDGAEVIARLYLEGNTGSVKGSTARVSHTGLEVVSVEAGDLTADASEIFLASYEDGDQLVIDLARLGQGAVIEGSGELAVVRFRAEPRHGTPALVEYDLRDVENHSLLRSAAAVSSPAEDELTREPLDIVATESLPAHVRLLGARPNPFGGSTEIAFRLPEATRVDIRIYDVEGRLVRSLAGSEYGAGEHVVAWDGRTESGDAAGIGVYLYRFQAGQFTESAKLYRYR